MSENLIIAIFLQAWLQSSPWPRHVDIRHRIVAQFEAINQVADLLEQGALCSGAAITGSTGKIRWSEMP
jgi:hypothetical protein